MSENNNHNTDDFSYLKDNGENSDKSEAKQSAALRTGGKSLNTKRIVGMAMFAALAFVVTLATSWAKVAFLTFDAKDAVITIAAFVYGPLSAVIISFLAAFVELITIGDTGWYGFVMNFVSSAAFSLTAAYIYKWRRSFNGAILGFFAAIAVTTGSMLLLNIMVTPLYMRQIGVPMTAEGVIDMIPKLLLPFNFAKALMNSALAMILYKPISQALRKAGMAKGEVNLKFNRQSVLLIIICSLALALAVTILIITGISNS